MYAVPKYSSSQAYLIAYGLLWLTSDPCVTESEQIASFVVSSISSRKLMPRKSYAARVLPSGDPNLAGKLSRRTGLRMLYCKQS